MREASARVDDAGVTAQRRTQIEHNNQFSGEGEGEGEEERGGGRGGSVVASGSDRTHDAVSRFSP